MVFYNRPISTYILVKFQNLGDKHNIFKPLERKINKNKAKF